MWVSALKADKHRHLEDPRALLLGRPHLHAQLALDLVDGDHDRAVHLVLRPLALVIVVVTGLGIPRHVFGGFGCAFFVYLDRVQLNAGPLGLLSGAVAPEASARLVLLKVLGHGRRVKVLHTRVRGRSGQQKDPPYLVKCHSNNSKKNLQGTVLHSFPPFLHV